MREAVAAARVEIAASGYAKGRIRVNDDAVG